MIEAFVAHYRDRHPFFAALAQDMLAELVAGRGGVITIGAAGSAAVAASASAAAEVPLPQAGDVFLRIEPGMHTAQIKRIGVDAACTLMVTGSEDKTARLWALPEGGRGSPELLRTLRVPIGDGYSGRIYAAALSPNGKWVAVGGYDVGWPTNKAMSVYIFESSASLLAIHGPRLVIARRPWPPRRSIGLDCVAALAMTGEQSTDSV